MKFRKWHWARIKKSIYVDDSNLLSLVNSEPFTISKGTIVWVREGSFVNSVHVTFGPEITSKIGIAYQFIGHVNYSDLLEPLE